MSNVMGRSREKTAEATPPPAGPMNSATVRPDVVFPSEHLVTPLDNVTTRAEAVVSAYGQGVTSPVATQVVLPPPAVMGLSGATDRLVFVTLTFVVPCSCTLMFPLPSRFCSRVGTACAGVFDTTTLLGRRQARRLGDVVPENRRPQNDPDADEREPADHGLARHGHTSFLGGLDAPELAPASRNKLQDSKAQEGCPDCALLLGPAHSA